MDLLQKYRPQFEAMPPKLKKGEVLPSGFEPLRWRIKIPASVNPMNGDVILAEAIRSFSTPRARDEFFALAEAAALKLQLSEAQPLLQR